MTDALARRQQSGFTLLELLISISILSLILVMLTGGVRFAGNAWQRAEAQSARNGGLDAVQSVLRQTIASGRNFRGTSTALKLVGTLPTALNRGGLFDIEIRTLDRRLVMAWHSHLEPTTAPASPETELAAGLAGFEFSYLVTGRGWQPSLEGSRPALLRITANFADGRNWPPLIIKPMIDAPANGDQ